jgi:type IV secretion system protein VirD4
MTFGRRLLLGASVLGGFPVAVGGWATQHVAATYGYSNALGGPVIGRIYAPWQFIAWWFAYQPNPPAIIDHAYWVALGAYGSLTLALSAALLLGGRRSRPHKDLHGTAHWASIEEIRASGLLSPSSSKTLKRPPGIIVGARRHGQRLDYLTHVGPEHVLLVAPTRSGKGVSVIVPTLLTWPASMVVHDLKGELHALSAGWRAQHAHNRIIRFDPAAPADKTHKFNPLSELRIGTNYEVADAQNAATIIVDPDGKGLHDHWTKTAHALLTGVLLYCMYKSRVAGDPTRHTANLYDVAYALSDPSRPVAELYDAMIQNTFGVGGGHHPVIAAAGRDMLNRPDAERGSVLSTTMSYLTLYRDPMVKANTSCSDFAVADLMHGDRPMTLYLVIRPADKDRLRPLMRLMITLILRRLTSRELVFEHGQPKQDYKHRLLLLLDEFASLGKLDIIRENLAYIAGWGINALISMQNRQQFLESFGRDDSTAAQCKVTIAFAPNDEETAEWLSKSLGTETRIKQSITESGKRSQVALNNVSTTYNEVSRRLMTADELIRLRAPHKDADGQITRAGDVVMTVAGFAPILGEQSLYFLDPVLLARAGIATPAIDTQLVPDHANPTSTASAAGAASTAAAVATTAPRPQSAPNPSDALIAARRERLRAVFSHPVAVQRLSPPALLVVGPPPPDAEAGDDATASTASSLAEMAALQSEAEDI